MTVDWVQIGPYLIAAVGVPATIITAKIQHKGKPENALIDQLQEQIKTDRDASQSERDEMKADIKELKTEQRAAKKREQIRDTYILQLREHINQGNPPPPPEWPEGLYD